jgi:segregation and condensation protein B
MAETAAAIKEKPESTSFETEVSTQIALSKDAQARIEVALYASGRPLSLEEISKVSKIASKRRLHDIMRELANRINSTFVAMELKEIEGSMYSLQLKPIYNSIAKKFATKPLLSTGTLRTLSYIVYLQPVSAHELVQRRGSQTYSHLKELAEVGFLRYERRGRSRVFTTTDSFADYFGLSRDHDLQRRQVVKQKGLVPKQAPSQDNRTADPDEAV